MGHKYKVVTDKSGKDSGETSSARQWRERAMSMKWLLGMQARYQAETREGQETLVGKMKHVRG